jgi:hypothetical protein
MYDIIISLPFKFLGWVNMTGETFYVFMSLSDYVSSTNYANSKMGISYNFRYVYEQKIVVATHEHLSISFKVYKHPLLVILTKV